MYISCTMRSKIFFLFSFEWHAGRILCQEITCLVHGSVLDRLYHSARYWSSYRTCVVSPMKTGYSKSLYGIWDMGQCMYCYWSNAWLLFKYQLFVNCPLTRLYYVQAVSKVKPDSSGEAVFGLLVLLLVLFARRSRPVEPGGVLDAFLHRVGAEQEVKELPEVGRLDGPEPEPLGPGVDGRVFDSDGEGLAGGARGADGARATGVTRTRAVQEVVHVIRVLVVKTADMGRVEREIQDHFGALHVGGLGAECGVVRGQ